MTYCIKCFDLDNNLKSQFVVADKFEMFDIVDRYSKSCTVKVFVMESEVK